MNYSHTIVVCSKDRLQELFEFIDHISQIDNYLEIEIVIVENSNTEANYELLKKKIMSQTNAANIRIVRCTPGLANSRNKSFSFISSDIVHFLDDDVILPRNYILEVDAKFVKYPDIAGLSPYIEVDSDNSRESVYKKMLFNLFAKFQPEGKLTKSGHAFWLNRTRDDRFVNWLPGCCMVYRFDDVKSLRFDIRLELGPLGGYALGEDLDFSHRVSKEFTLLAAGSISVIHKLAQNERTNWLKMDEGIGRLRAYLLVRFPKDLSLAHIFLSLIAEGFYDLTLKRKTRTASFDKKRAYFIQLKSFLSERKIPLISKPFELHEN